MDLASNTIYLHFIYVGNRAPDSIIEKVSRVHNHFRRNLSGCNLLAQHFDQTGRLKRYDIKTILWYDKHAPNIELGQHIEAKKVDELGNDAITQGCSPSVINSLLGFAKAKSDVAQGAIAADILRFIALYTYGGFYIDCGYAPAQNSVFNFNPAAIENALKFAYNGLVNTDIPISNDVGEYLFLTHLPSYEKESMNHQHFTTIYPNFDSHIVYSAYAKHPALKQISELSNAAIKYETQGNNPHHLHQKYQKNQQIPPLQGYNYNHLSKYYASRISGNTADAGTYPGSLTNVRV